MEPVQGIAHRELSTLRKLASDVAAAEMPELDLLDQIASLAAEVAARYREAARHQLLERVAQNTPAVFPGVSVDLPSRLAQASLPELSRFDALLDQAKAAREALTRADTELMAARQRGDYAAMAPLAWEADTSKGALAAACAEFEDRLGPAAVATEEAAPAPIADMAAGTPVSPHQSPAGATSFPAEATESNLVELGAHPGTRAERRRIRDLIRQVRTLPDEAS